LWRTCSGEPTQRLGLIDQHVERALHTLRKVRNAFAHTTAVAFLVALLEAGTTPLRREWDAASGGHHVNLLSGRRYRGANPALLTLGLHLRGSALPYWCGFAEPKALEPPTWVSRSPRCSPSTPSSSAEASHDQRP
jgi:hypothetical protein